MPQDNSPRERTISIQPVDGLIPPVGTRPSQTRSFLAVIAGAVAIGFSPIIVRLSETGPVATAFWRLTLALPVMWTLAALERRNRPVSADPGEARWWPMLPAGVLFAVELAMWNGSVKLTSVANSTLLGNFAPIFVVLFGWLAFRHRVTRRFLLAMGVALAGTCLLVGNDFRLQPRALTGDALALAAAVFYGGYQLSIKILRGRFDTAAIMARTGMVSALVLLPLALLLGEKMLPDTRHGWQVLILLALVVHVGGQGLIAYGMAKLPASVASVSLLIQPVTAAVAAAVMLSERVAPIQSVGIALVLAGVFVARQEGK